MIRQYTLPALALAAAGTIVSTQPINGELQAIHIAFSTLGGTLVVASVATPAQTLLTIGAAGTAWYYPRVNIHSTAGGTLAYANGMAQVEEIPLVDYVQASVNAGGTATVNLLVESE